MATFRNTFSDYRRWVSPALFNATLESQLEQWWPKGQYFSQAVVNFQTSRAQLLPNLAGQLQLDKHGDFDLEF